jgi:beta-galactosidase
MMKKFFTLFLVLFFIHYLGIAQLIDKSPPPVPVVPSIYDREPWEDPLVSGINRDPARATAYSFANVSDALIGDRKNSDRMLSLNGEWDFSFAIKPSDTPKDFYKTKVSGWKKIEVPSNWEMKGMTSLFIKVLFILSAR